MLVSRIKKRLSKFITPIKICSVCKASNASYLALPNFYKEQSENYGYKHFGRGETISLDSYSCSICNASDRERLYAEWIDSAILSKKIKGSLIHFAPESSLSKYLREMNYFEYETADMMMEGVDHNIDITDMPFENESYDFFICSHVLEHVDDDRKAIAELYRVLKFGGKGILMAPICQDIDDTHEDSSITTPEGRWANFGQDDHVRLYSKNDYIERIEDKGFIVDQFDIKHFGKKKFQELGLSATSNLYVVSKL